MKFQEVHDRLVDQRPETAACPADCIFCSGEYASSMQEDIIVSDKTYTEEEIAAAVATATADLRAELDAMKSSAETAEVDARIAAAKAEADVQVAELQVRIDALTVESEAAKADRDAITTWLDAESAKTVAEAEAAARLEGRVAAVAAVITFPEDRIEERKSDWASLSDEAFEALVADYKALGEKGKTTEGLPLATAMHATRESDGAPTSALAEIIRGRNFGVDPRSARR